MRPIKSYRDLSESSEMVSFDIFRVLCSVIYGRILEKYKDLMFFDPDTGKTFKVWGRNLEFHSGSRRTGVEKGWGLVCINDESEEEEWVLNEENIELIGSHAQAHCKRAVSKLLVK